MAERVITIKMNIDGTESVKELESISEAMGTIEDSLRNLSKKDAVKGAEEAFRELNKLVENNVLSMQELGTAADNYKNIALSAGKSSPIGQEALKRAGQLEREFDQLNQSVAKLAEGGRGLSTALSLGSGVVAGYTAFQSVTALLGKENENLQEVFVKLQATQSALMALQELKVALDKKGLLVTTAITVAEKAKTVALQAGAIAQKALNAVMKANPLGLIITAVGIVIGLFADWKQSVLDFIQPFVNLANMVLEFLGLIDQDEAKMEANRKKRIQAITNAHKQRLKQLQEQRDEEAKQFDARQSQLDLEIERMEALGQSSSQLRLQKAEDLKKELEAQLQFIKDSTESWRVYYENLRAQRGVSREDFIKQLKGQGIDIEQLQTEQQKLLDNLEAQIFSSQSQILKVEREIQAERTKYAEEEMKKRIDIEKRGANEIAKIVNNAGTEQTKLQGEAQNGMIQQNTHYWQMMGDVSSEALQKQHEEEMAILQARMDKVNETISILQAGMELANEINELVVSLEEERIAKIEEDRDTQLEAQGEAKDKSIALIEEEARSKLANDKLSAEQRRKIEQQLANDRALIEYQFQLSEFKAKQKAEQSKEQIERKAFKRQKALKLVEIGINTAASVMQALGSFPPPASFIFAGINATMGIVQSAIVASQKYKSSGGSVSPPSFSPPSVGGGGSGSGSGGSGSGGGGGQNDTTTSVAGLLEKEKDTKVTVSQVEINENQNQMAKVDQVATI